MVETIDDLRLAHGGRHAQQPLCLVDQRPEIRITCRGDKKIDMAGTGIAADVCARDVILDLNAQQTCNLQTTEILQ